MLLWAVCEQTPSDFSRASWIPLWLYQGVAVRSSCSWSRPGCFFMCVLIVCICMEQVKSMYPIAREWWPRFMLKLNVPGFCPKENVLTKYFCSASLSLACCQLLYQELCWENKLHKGVSRTDPIYFVYRALLWEYALHEASCNSGSWLFAFCNLLVSYIGILSISSCQYVNLLLFFGRLIVTPVTKLSVPGDWNLWVSDTALWLPEEQDDGYCSQSHCHGGRTGGSKAHCSCRWVTVNNVNKSEVTSSEVFSEELVS